jgi:hypothetical protein
VWLSALIGGCTVIALALAYPQANLQDARYYSAQRASTLSTAYLEAWLRVKPESSDYLYSLAMQYLELGRWESALAIAERLAKSATDDHTRQQAILVEVTALERISYSIEADDPRRADAVAHLADVLEKTEGYQWNVEVLRSLAEKARAAGAEQLMLRFYRQLALDDTANSARWYAELGHGELSRQAYEAAASAYFSAYEAARDLQGKRDYFIRALKVLESANEVKRACSEAERRLGNLAMDRQTVRYLLDLARQAGRTDLAARYARTLLELPSPSPVAALNAYDDGRARMYHVSTLTLFAMADARPGDQAGLEEEYDLIFKAFMESGELDDAEKVARKALDAGLNPSVWTLRLAQVAQWNNASARALTYWLQYAQVSGDEEAWDRVLKLAPEFDDDQAYLAAWRHRQAGSVQAGGGTAGSGPDAAAGLEELLARYISIGHWESALRVIGQIRSLEADQAGPRMLLLEVLALQQRAYQFPPEDAQRQTYLAMVIAALEQASRHDWDVSETSWLAQKSREVGAEAIMTGYYRKLTSIDKANAAQWHEHLGNAALARGAYEDAAMAYFAARDAAASRDEKRRYFQAGLQAFVSGGDVQRACVEGEQRAGELEQDPATLRYLINLARQAHRTDLMSRYARQLIELSRHDWATPQYADFGEVDARGMRRLAGAWNPAQALPTRHADFRVGSDSPSLYRTAGQADPQSPGAAAELKDDFEVAFRALLDSQQFDGAESVAERALAQNLDPLVWALRLAQVAQWNNHPEKALKYWLQYARLSDDENAWTTVQTLAFQLGDDSAYLVALKRAANRSPGNPELLDQVAGAYERLGERQAGMAWLQSRARGSMRQPALERYAALAARRGDDEAARQTYRELVSLDPANPTYAVQLAMLDYGRGRADEALSTLRQVGNIMGSGPETVSYWRLYGELARLGQSDQDADIAYRGLLATGQAGAGDLSAMASTYQAYPLDAGRIAELEFRQSGSASALGSALRHYTAARAWPRAAALLDEVQARQPAMIETSDALLAARADYYFHTGRRDEALADLRRAVQLPGATDQSRVAYLWALVNVGTSSELRMAMQKWRVSARANGDYADVLAAAEMRLGNAARAVHHLRRQRLQRGDDPLWLMALANAEEAAGGPGRAWRIRRHAWRLMKGGETLRSSASLDGEGRVPVHGADPASAERSRAWDAAKIGLSGRFANADYSRALLVELLNRDGASAGSRAVASRLGDAAGLPPLAETLGDADATPLRPDGQPVPRREVVDAVAKEVVLAWAMSGEHYDLARAWLASQYVDRLLRPADAELVLALAADDDAAVEALLRDRQEHISTDIRIGALVRTGRLDQAQTLAYRAAEGAPDSDARHQVLVQTLTSDRPAVGGDILYSDAGPLHYTQRSLAGSIKLTSRIGVAVEAIDRNQHTADSDQLAWVPAHDRQLALTVSDSTPSRNLSLTVGARNAWESFYTLGMRAEFDPHGSLKTVVEAGFNQPTYLSQYMQVGATEDTAQLAMQWSPGSRWFLQGSAKAGRFHAQDRTYMGHGFNLNAAVGYRLRASYPDWSARVVGARGIYSASDNAIPSLRAMLPAGDVPTAATFMPENFTQYGLLIGFGTSAKNAHTRSWRPFLDAGYIRDSNQGWGPVINTGIGGPVLGNDRLTVFYLHAAAPQGRGQSVTQVGLSYRLFF